MRPNQEASVPSICEAGPSLPAEPLEASVAIAASGLIGNVFKDSIPFC